MCGESGLFKMGSDDSNLQHEPIETREIVIGQYADYFNTGIWSMVDGQIVAPDDLTIEQLKDFLTASGGAVYLRHDRKLCWVTTK